LDVLIVAGFLGSGKTTLILSLARHAVRKQGRKVAIIENEIGQVGIDDNCERLACPSASCTADASVASWSATW